jgi:hypothetical protein
VSTHTSLICATDRIAIVARAFSGGHLGRAVVIHEWLVPTPKNTHWAKPMETAEALGVLEAIVEASTNDESTQRLEAGENPQKRNIGAKNWKLEW